MVKMFLKILSTIKDVTIYFWDILINSIKGGYIYSDLEILFY